MEYLTHKFDDKLGGTFKYMDEPGRLDTLLAKDKKSHRKSTTQGEINISAQAKWYVDHIVKNDVKVLVFYPLKSNMRSLSNEFQYLVLRALPLPYAYRASQMDHLRELRRLAVQNGYALTEYDDTVEVLRDNV